MLNINTQKPNDSVAHYIIYIISIFDLTDPLPYAWRHVTMNVLSA